MTEYKPLTKDQVHEYADNFLRFLDANPGKVPADNWHEWRVSLGVPYPVDRPNDERRIREFLVLHDCITNPRDAYTTTVALRPSGRLALDFDGGPLACWRHEEEFEKLKVDAIKNQSRPKKLTRWDYAERVLKFAVLPGAIVAGISLWPKSSTQVEQPDSPDQEVAPPASAQSSVLDNQAIPPIAPIDTLSNSSSNKGLSP